MKRPPSFRKRVIWTSKDGLTCWIEEKRKFYLVKKIPMELVADAVFPEAKIEGINFLTPREREIFNFTLRGKANKETAASLNISVRTIKQHLTSVYKKLGVQDRYQLMAMYGRQEQA